MSRITKLNAKTNRELIKLFTKKDIRYCEPRISPTCSPLYTTFAHRHKRSWYLDKPDELRWSFDQVMLACPACHDLMEFNKSLTRAVFDRLRSGMIVVDENCLH